MIGIVARRYGTALFEALLELPPPEAEAGLRQLSALQDLCAPDWLGMFAHPHIPLGKKRELATFLGELTGNVPVVGRFLQVVVSERRMSALSEILAFTRELADRRQGRIRVHVETPVAMDPQFEHTVGRTMSEAFDRQAVLDAHVDPSLLAGMVIRVGNLVIDSSLRSRLTNLMTVLNPGV